MIGLYFIVGSFAQSSIYSKYLSKYLALQVKTTHASSEALVGDE